MRDYPSHTDQIAGFASKEFGLTKVRASAALVADLFLNAVLALSVVDLFLSVAVVILSVADLVLS